MNLSSLSVTVSAHACTCYVQRCVLMVLATRLVSNGLGFVSKSMVSVLALNFCSWTCEVSLAAS